MMDAKYVVGSKYWRMRHDLWVMTKEGNIKEVLGVGVFGGDDMGMWRKLSLSDGVGCSPWSCSINLLPCTYVFHSSWTFMSLTVSSGLSLVTNLGHDHMPPQLHCSKFPWWGPCVFGGRETVVTIMPLTPTLLCLILNSGAMSLSATWQPFNKQLVSIPVACTVCTLLTPTLLPCLILNPGATSLATIQQTTNFQLPCCLHSAHMAHPHPPPLHPGAMLPLATWKPNIKWLMSSFFVVHGTGTGYYNCFYCT